MKFITEIIERLQAESPRFFVALRWIMAVLAALAAVTKWVIAREVWQPQFAAVIQEACGYILTAFVSVWGISFLPKKDNPPTWKP